MKNLLPKHETSLDQIKPEANQDVTVGCHAGCRRFSGSYDELARIATGLEDGEKGKLDLDQV